MKGMMFYCLMTSFLCIFDAQAKEPALKVSYSEPAITLAAAKKLAEITQYACQQAGFNTVVTVVDHRGALKVVLVDDGSFPHAIETSLRKARTAASRRIPSGEVVSDNDHEPTISDTFHAIGLTSLGGGLPIYRDGQVIGGVAVAGAPGENEHGEDHDIQCLRKGLGALGLL